jgi:alpha-mannosidase
VTVPRTPSAPLEAHLVSHTHWDREWYLPAARFRQRLVALIDELLADDTGPGAFLLDGQAIVLEDYLAIRPDRRSAVMARLASGRIEAGPWYVLADELIPGAEALVRNLFAGRRILRALGATAPGVLYSPDAFGHPAALPTLAAGFGFPLVILWRGYGSTRWPAGDVVRWRGADGSGVLLYHLPRSGYEFASSLPADPSAANERWRHMREELAPRSVVGVVLLPNGADHHARQHLLPEAIEALAAAAAPDRVIAGSLGGFATALRNAAAESPLPLIQGELRDSYGYTWTLQGTFASRAHQKRANAHCERLLVRDAEPWAALAWARGGFSRRALVESAWTTLLACHPHDTLCGCSIDAVARAMDARLEQVATEGTGIRDDALLDIVGHDAVRARTARRGWREVLIVRNPAPRPRGGIAEVEIRRFIADVPVGPGSAHAAPPRRLRLPPPELDGGRVPLQILGRSVAYDRVESARHYPDNDLVEVTTAVAWVPQVRGYGTHTFALDAIPGSPTAPPARVQVKGSVLDNGILTVAIDDAGSLAIASIALGARIAGVLHFQDVPDVGDLYTHAAGSTGITHASFLGAHVVQRGPLRATIDGRWRLRMPESAATGGEQVALTDYATPATPMPAIGQRPLVPLELEVRITLDAGSSVVGIEISGDNVARDHRLRAIFSLGLPDAEVWADAAFGSVRRSALVVPEHERAMETPVDAAPLHRYVSLYDASRGATLFSDGLAEYEVLRNGAVAVTLVRAVGELSRNDLPERPGHAGWPASTPAAQCVGRFTGRFALMLHAARSPETIAAVEETADDVLLPLQGMTLRSALTIPPPTSGIELIGRGLAFGAAKESEDGNAVALRCVNLTDEVVRGAWRLGFTAHDARLARLDETPLEPLAIIDGEIRFTAPPRAVMTILAR